MDSSSPFQPHFCVRFLTLCTDLLTSHNELFFCYPCRSSDDLRAETDPAMESLSYSASFCRFYALSSRQRFHLPNLNCSRIKDPRLRIKPLLPPQSFRVHCEAHADDQRHHEHRNHQHQHQHHDHEHHHQHHHHHGYGDVEPKGAQRALWRFAKAVGWVDLANFLRENLQLCCFSTGLFVAAAVCPYLVPKVSVKLLQNMLILIAFPIVGVSCSILISHFTAP